MRFLEPVIRSSGRNNVKSINQPPFFTETLVWSAQLKYFYIENFKKNLTRLVDSKIYGKIREILDGQMQKSIKFKVKSSFRTSSVQIFASGNLKDLKTLFSLLLLLCFACVSTLVLQAVLVKRNFWITKALRKKIYRQTSA